MNTRRWIITVSACVLVLAALAGYKVMQIRAAIAFAESFPEPSETVEAVVTEVQQVQDSMVTIGEIIAPQTVALRNEIEGRVTAVNFVSGARVKQGDVLLQLDTSEEQARLQAAHSRVELAQLDLQRISELRKKRAISKERLDQAKAQHEIAIAEVQALKAVIAKKTLRAPFDARTGLHEFEAGELLPANTLITTLVGLNDYTWVDFNLPYQQATLEVGSDVTITVSGHPEPVTGIIIAKESVASAASRNLRFRARIAPGYDVAPNTIVKVSVPVGVPQQWTRIPVTAVRYDGLGAYVYVLDAEQAGAEPQSYRARRQQVSLGSEQDQQVVIKSGLEPGLLVATQGSFKLRNQLRVFVAQRKPLAGN